MMYSCGGKYNAFSVDVEDGVNILMHDLFGIEMPPTLRVVKNVRQLLCMLEENNVRATFFILGEIALKYPYLIREIAGKGHELGVHGYHHDQIYKLTPEKTRHELYKAKALIEDISGEQTYGFRAPAFSVSEKTSWVLEIIADLGFKYDSSVIPAKGKRYGWPGFERDITRLILHEGNTLIEVPLTVVRFFNKEFPACGGGYLRYFPYCFTRRSCFTIQKQRPVIVYLHPYEIDIEKYPDFFYKAKATLGLGQRLPLLFYRLNKDTVERKLKCLVDEFAFKPVIELIEDMEKQNLIKSRPF